MVSIAGVLVVPPLCTGKGDIVVVTMTEVTPKTFEEAVYPRLSLPWPSAISDVGPVARSDVSAVGIWTRARDGFKGK